MKIVFKLNIFLLVFTLQTVFLLDYAYADRVQNNSMVTIYEFTDGSLDWAAFYEDWDKVPNDYYMYIKYEQDNSEPPESALLKFGPGADLILGNGHDIEFSFIQKGLYAGLMVKFSPYNYTNARNEGWIPMGIKRNNYNSLIDRWNYYIDLIRETMNRMRN